MSRVLNGSGDIKHSLSEGRRADFQTYVYGGTKRWDQAAERRQHPLSFSWLSERIRTYTLTGSWMTL
jgi:hypothetical protein